MREASDLEKLEYAPSKERCMVTRNRNDFICLTFQFFKETRPLYGVLIVPYSYPDDRFRQIAKALQIYAIKHKDGMTS